MYSHHDESIQGESQQAHVPFVPSAFTGSSTTAAAPRCGMNDELGWLERRARAQGRQAGDGPLAISLAQISLKISQLRRVHAEACHACGEQPWTR
jgi:hypothetical protein